MLVVVPFFGLEVFAHRAVPADQRGWWIDQEPGQWVTIRLGRCELIVAKVQQHTPD